MEALKYTCAYACKCTHFPPNYKSEQRLRSEVGVWGVLGISDQNPAPSSRLLPDLCIHVYVCLKQAGRHATAVTRQQGVHGHKKNPARSNSGVIPLIEKSDQCCLVSKRPERNFYLKNICREHFDRFRHKSPDAHTESFPLSNKSDQSRLYLQERVLNKYRRLLLLLFVLQ